MAETEADNAKTEGSAAPKKGMKAPLLIGIILMLGLGGGGFFATSNGMVDGLLGKSAGLSETAEVPAEGDAGINAKTQAAGDAQTLHGNPTQVASFVQLEPLIISLGTGRDLTHLRFSGHLEVEEGSEDVVLALMPRVLDVLNSYLRAIDPVDLAEPSKLIRYRAQMLRRIQLVIGDGRVKDLLIAEFVLN